MIINKFFTGFYSRMAEVYLHKGWGEERARSKAYTKTLFLSGAIYFFLYIFLMNALNQLFFHLPNTRMVGLVMVGPFVLLFYLLAGERILKPYLKPMELDGENSAEKIRSFEWRNNIIAIMAGVYAAGMFVLIRMSNIYIFNLKIRYMMKTFRELETHLLNGKITEKQVFYYLLVQLALVCILLQLPFEEEPLWWVWLLVSLGVILGGVSWTFSINRKGGNKDYLLRFISISFMAVMRCLLLVLIISVLEGIYAIIKGSSEFSVFWTAFQEKALNVLRGFILIFYFFYMIPSFKRLNAAEAEGSRVAGETR